MPSLLDFIRRSEDDLAQAGIKRARREAEEVIADVLNMKRIDLYLQFDRRLNERELSSLREAIKRRAKREPRAYICGSVIFSDIKFHVTPAVLVPRPETELLVEKISETLKSVNLENKVLWDVCCGSGCIGIALKHRFPELKVVLSDLSEEALEIARKNSEGNTLFKQGDLFEPFENERCDFFVCNPPYISEQTYSLLEPEVNEWEPKQALVAGQSGYEFYERIAKELKKYLNTSGKGWLELGSNQGEEVTSLFKQEGYFCHCESDLAGHDRFFFIESF